MSSMRTPLSGIEPLMDGVSIAMRADAPSALALAVPVLVFKLAIGGALLALIETLSAKMRIFRVPEFLGTAFLIAVIAMLIHILLGA